MNNENLIDVLIWHFECKKFAIERICSLTTPADKEITFEARMYHSVYLQSFISIVDIMKEEFPTAFLNKLQEKFITQSFPDGKNNYLYVRELRNIVAHRKPDITCCAHIINQQICVVAPPTTTSDPQKKRKGKGIETYQAFEEYMRDIFVVCEKSLNELVYEFLKSSFNSIKEMSINEYEKEINGAYGMPDWVKAMAIGAFDSIPFADVKSQQNEKLIELLLNNKSLELAIIK